MSNLFSRLFKYSESENLSPLENFTTELLAYVLKYDDICKYILGCSINNNDCITTQENLGTFGIADILITDYLDKCFIIENKIEAGFQPNQLSRYNDYAGKYNDHKVIVITKYSCEPNDVSYADKILSWLEVSEKLKEVASHNKCDKILHEFIKFLEEEDMALNKVNWQIIDGLKEKQHFLDMLRMVLDKLQGQKLIQKNSKDSHSEDYNELHYDYKGVAVSINFTHSDAILYILIHDPQNKCNELPRHNKWPVNAVVSSFDLNKKHFFPLSSSEQLLEIENFLLDSLKLIK